MAHVARCRVGIILEKRPSANEWIDHEWVTTGASVDATANDDWVLLHEMSGIRQYLSPPVTLELFASDTESYVYNLDSPSPSLFAVLREDEESRAEVPFNVHLVTLSPYEAQDYLDSSEEHVDRIALDAAMRAWLERFVDEHHVEEEFIKRKRDKHRTEEYKFGQEPLVELRKRRDGNGSGSLH